MKRFFVSFGLAASAVGIQSALGQAMTSGASPKIWNVSANLRGAAINNVLYYTSGSGAAGDITVHGYEV